MMTFGNIWKTDSSVFSRNGVVYCLPRLGRISLAAWFLKRRVNLYMHRLSSNLSTIKIAIPESSWILFQSIVYESVQLAHILHWTNFTSRYFRSSQMSDY